MNFMNLLLQRESCRSFCDRPVAREDLLQVVEAGRLSPSGCNAQPWKFIIVDEPEPRKRLRDALVVGPGKVTGCPWRDEVPAFIVLVEQPARLMPAAMEYYQDSQRFAQGDIGMAALNMCYAAAGLGLATCILGMIDQAKMEAYFKIPPGRPVRMALAVGYSASPDAAPRPKVRKDLAEVCSLNQW